MSKTVFPAPGRGAFAKILLVMKLTLLLMIAASIGVHAAGISQTMTLSGKELSLERIFSQVKKQTGYVVFYNQALLKDAKTVSVEVRDMPLEGFLSLVLKDQPIGFRKEDKTIVLHRKNYAVTLMGAGTALPPEVIKGLVRGSDGTPLSGATVHVKGSNTYASTDAKGNFSIRAAAKDTLVFSFIGFEQQEIAVAGITDGTAFVVDLSKSNSSLDEVVVVGYGKVKRRDLTGAVSTVKAEDIKLSPVLNPMEALQGRVSGLDIQRTTGEAGKAPTVLLRGNRSLSANQDPLYIIDGIPGNINNLNPNDIESIDVLKDASSTAIYGTQGANGVIMVTTKKAKAGRLQIDASSYVGVNGFATFPAPLQGEAWLGYQRERFFLNNGAYPTSLADMGFTPAVISAIEKGQWVNWVDETMKTGVQQNHYISLRGGSDKAQAYLSLGYIGEKGIYENDKAESYNARGGVDLKFSNMFKTGFQAILSYKKSNSAASRVNKAYSIAPLGQPYDSNGVVKLFPVDGDNSIINVLANNYPGAYANNGKNFNLQFNPYIEFSPIKNLTLRSNFGGTLAAGRTGTFEGKNSYIVLTQAGRNKAKYETSQNYNYIWENFLTYTFSPAREHNVTITGITSYASSDNEKTSMGGENLDYEELLYYNIGALQSILPPTNTFAQQKRMSYAGRINYAYKGKYLLQVTSRWDGDSRLAEGNKWSAFPSASFAWRAIDESFMAGTRSWLNDLKLRVGYGVSGLANIDPYSSLTQMVARNASVLLGLGGSTSLPVYVPSEKTANPELTWERSKNANFGLEASVLNNRIDVMVDFYKTKTTGILWDRRLPTSSGGFDAKTPYKKSSNIATSENQGWEVTVSSRNIVKKDFQWNSSLTFTAGKEKLVNIDLGNRTVAELVSENLFIGHPTKDVFYGYKKIGIWQLGEETEAAKYGAKPGDMKLQTVEKIDANGVSDKGVHPYSTTDRMVLGSKTPKWFLGFQNTFRYKAFDLTVFVNARYGQMTDAQVLGYWGNVAQPSSYDYWTPTNPTNDFPKPGSSFNTQFIDGVRFVDASYIKIKNITLGFTLPQTALNAVKLSNLRVYATAYNPFIFAKERMLRDVDPENGGADSFPLFKQYVFGINLSL